MSKAKGEKIKKTQSVVAKSDDGTIQITFTVPFEQIKKGQKEAAIELGKDMQVPGFRQGKAPLDKVIKQIPQNSLIEKTLGNILPKLVAEAINKHKIKPAVYPKFELVKAAEGEDWQIRAVTCEIGEVELGDYKKAIAGSVRAKTIWTPGAGSSKKAKEPTREEKQQEIIKTLLETVKLSIPKLLIDEEVNRRLSSLLERLEKLGLTLESYLASIGKTAETLRKEYETQAREALKLDLILNKIAEVENIAIKEEQVAEAIKASSGDPKLAERLNNKEQRSIIRSILKRRAALDSLVSLV